METIRAYTDVEQSKVLAEILPLESADMLFQLGEDKYADSIRVPLTKKHWEQMMPAINPCWSLASLLEQLPYEVCDDDGNSLYLQIDKEEDLYQLMYGDTDPYASFESIETDRYEHFVDACVAMIEKLNELKML